MSGLAEEELDRSPAGRWLRIAGGILLAVLAGAALVYLLKDLGGSAGPPKKQVTRITVLPDTPPPPPPPPKEEIRQPKEAREAQIEQPRPVELPQEAQQLKMEGPAGDAPSPFAAGAVTRDYIGGPVGAGRGGGGAQFAFFSNALQRHVQDELARHRRLRLVDYRVLVDIWIGAEGAIRRAELAGTSGSAEADAALRAALVELPPLRAPVPENLPQPIRLRVTNRMAG
jgi:protein TonB